MKFFIPLCMRRALLLAAQGPRSGVGHHLVWDCRALRWRLCRCFSFTDLWSWFAETLQLLTWELGKISQIAREKCDASISWSVVDLMSSSFFPLATHPGVGHHLVWDCRALRWRLCRCFSFTDLWSWFAETLQLLTWELGKISQIAREKCDIYIYISYISFTSPVICWVFIWQAIGCLLLSQDLALHWQRSIRPYGSACRVWRC